MGMSDVCFGFLFGISGAELIAICREAALFAIEGEDERKQHHQTGGGGMPKISMAHLLRSLKGRCDVKSHPKYWTFMPPFRTKTT
eukprot:scaffold323_cov51-Attheya_sp.AAC.4